MPFTIPLTGFRSLTTAVNKSKNPGLFLTDLLYRPRTETWPTEKIIVDVIVENQKLAPFVSANAPATVIEKDTDKSQEFMPPRIRMKQIYTGEDLNRLRAPNVPVFNPSSTDIANNRRVKLAADLQKLKNRIARRIEWMAAQSLSGAITYNGNEYNFNIDFLMPNEHKPVLAGGDIWGSGTENIVDNIREWGTMIGQDSSASDLYAVARSSVISKMLKNADVRAILDNRRVQVGDIQIGQYVNGARFIGVIEGVKIYEYENIFVDDAGNKQYMLPADKFVMFAADSDYRLHFGAINDVEAPTVQAEMFSKDWTEPDAGSYNVLLESHPLPVPHYPESIVYADVL